MTHAALTPLLGREFDPFLFASIGDERDGPLLSVVSALARLDVDPWDEAASLARMPRDLAKQRLICLIASLPNRATTGLAPEITAARLIALLPPAGSINTAAAATLRPVVRIPHSRLFIGLGLLVLLLLVYSVFAARASHLLNGGPDAPRATSESKPDVRLKDVYAPLADCRSWMPSQRTMATRQTALRNDGVDVIVTVSVLSRDGAARIVQSERCGGWRRFDWRNPRV